METAEARKTMETAKQEKTSRGPLLLEVFLDLGVYGQ